MGTLNIHNPPRLQMEIKQVFTPYKIYSFIYILIIHLRYQSLRTIEIGVICR